jgi:hypothetical protein
VGGALRLVRNGPVRDVDRHAAEGLGSGEVGDPLAADLLEVRSYDAGKEPGPGTRPDLIRQPPVQQGEFGPGDGVVEGDQRFADAVDTPVSAEGVSLLADESAVLKDREGVGDVAGGPLQATGDPARRGVAGGEGREHGVVQGPVPEVGFVGEEVAGLAVERGAGRERGTADPGVEVVQAGRDVVTYELPSVGGSSAHDAVHEEREPGVFFDAPERRSLPEVQWLYDEFETGAAPQG